MSPNAIAPGLYWSIKQSFVNYVASTAGGTYSMSTDVTVDESGTFHFPRAEARVDDDGTWTLQFTGDVRFSGHFGMLFVAVVDPQLVISPMDAGALTIADVAAPSADRRLTIATIDPARALPYDGYLVWPPLTPRLTPDGVGLFGDTYPEGLPLDALKVAIAPS